MNVTKLFSLNLRIAVRDFAIRDNSREGNPLERRGILVYEQTHEPEALRLSNILSKESTLSSIFLLDFSLPLVAKLRKFIQTE